MTDYHWELGIDWDAAIGPDNASYMPGGFVLPGTPGVVQRPHVLNNDPINNPDTIQFFIFDLTKVQTVNKIESFTINSRAGVPLQLQSSTDPLGKLQPLIPNPDHQSAASTYFGGTRPCWISEMVKVTEVADATEKKFLLTFFVQARGPQSEGPRTFAHDPEMVVGSNGT